MQSGKEKFQLYFLSSTHWDREWYLTFQAMRFRLADTLDELLDVMEAQPDFQLFCMDGQTVVLEDYMQAAPENRERLQRLIDEGRVKIGPWYVMPDARLVSGESLIENFLMGRRIAAKWRAETWKYGYMCDIFGHIAQTPQILRGFHLTGAYLGRGLHAPWQGLFRWQGPDGTEIPGYLGRYAEFTNGVTYHFSDADYERRLKALVDGQLKNAAAPVIVLADAFDHATVNPHTNRILADLKRLYPQAEIHHASLEGLEKEAEQYWEQLPLVQGELIDTTPDRRAQMRLVGQSMSSYYPLKYRNDRCQNRLERAARPLAALARLRGMRDRPALMRLAVEYLLKNQPHDSICGCSIDQVHRDMTYRYDQHAEITEEIIARACKALWPAPQNAPGQRLEILNPFLYNWHAPLRLSVAFPADYAHRFAESAGYEPRNAFRLLDAAGRETPYQLHGVERNVTRRTEGQKTVQVDLYDISFSAELQAMGVTALEVRPSDTPVRYGPGPFQCGPDFCDNGLVRLEIAGDGTLSILDHENGRRYTGLNRLLDDGEAGNGWFHDAPIGDTLRIAGAPVKLERLSAGPVQAAFRLTQRLPLPKGRENPEETALELQTTVTLLAGKRYALIDLALENTAADHRLRAQFPSGVQSGRYRAGQAFCFVERAAGVNPERLDWDEPESVEKSMNGLLCAWDGRGGLAFISPYGLHEGGMEADGTLSVTLLRSFSRVFMQENPEYCKLLGAHQYRYALLPLAGGETEAELVRLQGELDMEPPFRLGPGEAAAQTPWLRLEGERLAVSAVKAPEDDAKNALIVRLWNVSGQEAAGALHCALPLRRAARTALDETVEAEIPCQGGAIPLLLRPWQVLTLRLEMEGENE